MGYAIYSTSLLQRGTFLFAHRRYKGVYDLLIHRSYIAAFYQTKGYKIYCYIVVAMDMGFSAKSSLQRGIDLLLYRHYNGVCDLLPHRRYNRE